MIEAGGVDELERFVRELPDLLHRNTDLLSEAERIWRKQRVTQHSGPSMKHAGTAQPQTS